MLIFCVIFFLWALWDMKFIIYRKADKPFAHNVWDTSLILYSRFDRLEKIKNENFDWLLIECIFYASFDNLCLYIYSSCTVLDNEMHKCYLNISYISVNSYI